jgi:NADPH:quinone reductase-like Zn-dependent oxidoreductase
MQSSGVLVHAWPIVLGCDASGTVVSVGSAVTKFKEGDGVFGCTRLGVPGYATFQEYVSSHTLALNFFFNIPLISLALEECPFDP